MLTLFFSDVGDILDVSEGVLNLKLLQLIWLGGFSWREGVHVLLLLVLGGDGGVRGGDGGDGVRVSIGSRVLADVNLLTTFFSDVAGVLDVWREGVHVLLLLGSDGDGGPLGVAEGGGDGLPGLLSG